MKSLTKLSLLVSVSLLACAVASATASAIRWAPASTTVTGVSIMTNPQLTFGGAVTVTCGSATVKGTTGVNSPSLKVALTFSSCQILGVQADVKCAGLATLTATFVGPPGEGGGTVDLDAGFACVVRTFFCTIDITGPQDLPGANFYLTQTFDGLLLTITNLVGTTTGAEFCGPDGATATLDATYAHTPPGVRLDP